MGRRRQNLISSVSGESEEQKLTQLVDNLLKLTTSPLETNVNKALDQHSEIVELITQIQNLEIKLDTVTSPNLRSGGATIDNFEKWLVENGAQFEGIQIAEFPGYELGLQAKMDLNESSLIMTVPHKIILSGETVRDSSLKHLIQKDTLLSNMPNVALALVLLHEKFKENSFWKPYIDILPTTYSTVLYFTSDELKELKGSPVLESTLKHIRNICRQYAYLQKIISTAENSASKHLKKRFCFNQYRWAVSTVMTRQNTVLSEKEEKINALIPLWDLCNHMNGRITTDYNLELQRCECFALKNFKKGDQIFIYYGARSNADLFLHNGFVFEDNVNDGYLLRLGISKNDPFNEKRIKLFEKLAIKNYDFWIKKSANPIGDDLIAFLRIFNMDEDTLKYWSDNNDKVNDLKRRDCNLDICLENKCWKFLQARIKLLLSAYKTASIEKLELVSNPQISENIKLIIKMREIEKDVLRNALNYVEQQLSLNS